MTDMTTLYNDSPYKGSGNLTREQFLFYQMRTTAKLMKTGLSDARIVERIVSDNLFQYPTEKSIKKMASVCVKRLHLLDDLSLVDAIADMDSYTAKQICLYAMMRQYRLVWDFMLTVVGEKYRKLDSSFSKMDVNVFFMRLQEQDDWVAAWSDSTIAKVRQVIVKTLVENEYLDSSKAERLNPVLISPLLENAIRAAGQEIALPAFNCLN